MTNYIRFDWAMKRLLRDKANHSVIEGLLTSLFGEKVTIVKFLEANRIRTLGTTNSTVSTYWPRTTSKNS